jgi:hypothetical protein
LALIAIAGFLALCLKLLIILVYKRSRKRKAPTVADVQEMM